ncbi:helix-turn-helix domain-containing protein [Clostridium gasigenes]|uniref:Helix-turn-helix domain-containing protein n=1 Tax=Clostridium gasigenes TaxID=94869 RepID=A0A1H0LTT9_9CLOT|nr:helix-turn-helix transcriptional regulator [Clostridium gasigenes]SDO71515.1 Helix-turn-helix domain-containing protein [Clostridium gasigenes]
MDTFGERFKSIRLSKDLTQEQLINEFNAKYGYAFTKGTISQYENNRRTPGMIVIKQFVDYFNVSIDYLLANDLHVIKDIGQKYPLYNDDKSIDIKEIFNLIKSLSEEGTIDLEEKVINEEQRKILLNGLDVILGLIEKEIN